MKFRISSKHFSLTWILIAVLAVIITVMFSLTVPAFRSAEMTGRKLGAEHGEKVGMYLGSSKGTLEGISKSTSEGLSSEEYSTLLAETLKKTGSVTLLTAGIKSGYIRNGDSAGEISGITAVFSADFGNAQVTVVNDRFIDITLPAPSCRFTGSDGSEITGSKVSAPASAAEQARTLATGEAEKIASAVCGNGCDFSVKFQNPEGGDMNE